MDFIDKDFGLKITQTNEQQTSYSLTNKNSSSRMIQYHLYPGIDIVLSDFNEKYQWSGEWRMQETFYQISYNSKGVYQVNLKKNEFCYASPGKLVIFNSCKKSLDSKMTTNALQGFSILLFPSQLKKSLIEEWRSHFDFDINDFFNILPSFEKTMIFSCGKEILQLLEEIYGLLYNHEMGMLRLKLLELFYKMMKEDMKIEDRQRAFSKMQIEKTKMIKEHMELDLSKHYTIQELCYIYELSTTIFKQCFKMMFEYSPYEFLRVARMNQAGESLKNTDMSILEIGRSLGYENPSNFTRTFKDIYGILPSQYRASR